MTFMQIVARVLIYGVGWTLTANTFISLFNWAQPRLRGYHRFAACLIASLIWALILGIIYW